MDPQQGEMQKRQNETDGFLRSQKSSKVQDGEDVNRQTWAAVSGWRQASLNPQVPCEGSPKVFDLARTQQGTELSHVVRPTVRVPSRETLRTVQQGSFEGTHLSFVFLEEMVGTPEQERLTGSALYGVIYRELLASAQPGKPSKQAPRMLPHMLFFLEQLVMNETSPIYLRVYSWWMLVQNWATLRFSDHRGLNPGEVTFREGSFHARLTRSNTTGQDKTITSKPLVIDACCFLSHREWLTRGWSLLQGMANFPRDYLMPAPASHCQSCRKLELRYDAAFAMQNRVLRMFAWNGVPVFHSSSTRFWTPHSGRTSLPSATAALGSPSPRGISWEDGVLRRATGTPGLRFDVSQTCNVQSSLRCKVRLWILFAEDESIRDFDAFMDSQSLDASQRTLCFKPLDSVKLFETPHSQEELTITTPDDPEDGIILEDTEEAFHPVQPTSKRRKGNAEARTATLGENPKEARTALRSQMEPGYYVCLSGKKKTKTLHQLGKCYLLPSVDYLDYSYHGVALPRISTYDCICRLCAREGVRDDGDSSCTGSSSSTSSDGQWLALRRTSAIQKSLVRQRTTREVRDDPLCKCHPGHSFPFQGTLKYFLLRFLSFWSAAPSCSAFVSALAWLRPFTCADWASRVSLCFCPVVALFRVCFAWACLLVLAFFQFSGISRKTHGSR